MLTWSEPKSIEEIERVETFPADGKPFGSLNGRWEALKAEIQPGDQLKWFNTDRTVWKGLGGRSGVALIRDGVVVKEIITLMS